MEHAIFISKIYDLKCCDKRFTRLYFGNEFCEHLIPDFNDLDRALCFVSENNLDFTFVTPYVTDSGLEKLKPLLKKLIEAKPTSEVVFNDWGVLRLLRNNYGNLEPVLGRLLNRMKRGPRLMNVIDKIPSDALEYFKSSNITVPTYRKFLREKGIRRIELDNLLQGIKFDYNIDEEIEFSLYIPFAYVTTTRLCLVASCDIPRKKGMIGIFPCQKECRKYTFHMSHPIMPVTLTRKGNTIFFENEEIPTDMDENITRIVVEPEIPI